MKKKSLNFFDYQNFFVLLFFCPCNLMNLESLQTHPLIFASGINKRTIIKRKAGLGNPLEG